MPPRKTWHSAASRDRAATTSRMSRRRDGSTFRGRDLGMTARCSVLRAVGEARQSILQSKLLMPMPEIPILVAILSSAVNLSSYIAIVVTCAVSRWNERLLHLLLGVFASGAIMWFAICWYYRKLLHTTHADLELAPNQEVRRGCLVESRVRFAWDREESEMPETRGPSALKALFVGGAVPLTDFQFRACAYRIRQCVAGVVFLLAAAVGASVQCLQLEDTEVMRRILIMLFLIKCTMTLDTAAAAFAGVDQSPFGKLAKICLRCDRQARFRNSNFVPFDPRATCVQNIAFSVVLMPNTLVQLLIILTETDWMLCPSMWALQASCAGTLLLTLQLGAAYSYCPWTSSVGMLVQAGVIAPPCNMHGDDIVRLLTYGMLGPVIELQGRDGAPVMISSGTEGSVEDPWTSAGTLGKSMEH